MSRMIRWLGLVFIALIVIACSSSSNSLTGSVSQEYDLSYNSVVILLQASSIQIKYVGDNGDPCLLAVDIGDLQSIAGVSIKLTDIDPGTGQVRGTIDNIGSDGVTDQLPITRGNVIFDQTPKVGANLSGQFNATFVDGYTLDGTFSSPVNGP
jgi:hypothetical protein